MQEFVYGPDTRVRIWLHDLPDVHYPVEQVVEHHLPAQSSPLLSKRVAAIEHIRPSDISSYGLLGATFIPNQSEYFTLQIAVAYDIQSKPRGSRYGHIPMPTDGERVPWSLARPSYDFFEDAVFAGIPPYAVPLITEYALQGKDTLGTGIFRFDCGAHDFSRSSPAFFGLLTRCVVDLLAWPAETLTEEECATLIKTHWQVIRSRYSGRATGLASTDTSHNFR